MSDDNTDLLAPIAAILDGSPKPTAVKVMVLVDVAAAILARDGAMRLPAALRRTADAVRERLVVVTKATHDWMDERQFKPVVGTAPPPAAS